MSGDDDKRLKNRLQKLCLNRLEDKYSNSWKQKQPVIEGIFKEGRKLPYKQMVGKFNSQDSKMKNTIIKNNKSFTSQQSNSITKLMKEISVIAKELKDKPLKNTKKKDNKNNSKTKNSKKQNKTKNDDNQIQSENNMDEKSIENDSKNDNIDESSNINNEINVEKSDNIENDSKNDDSSNVNDESSKINDDNNENDSKNDENNDESAKNIDDSANVDESANTDNVVTNNDDNKTENIENNDNKINDSSKNENEEIEDKYANMTLDVAKWSILEELVIKKMKKQKKKNGAKKNELIILEENLKAMFSALKESTMAYKPLLAQLKPSNAMIKYEIKKKVRMTKEPFIDKSLDHYMIQIKAIGSKSVKKGGPDFSVLKNKQ